MQRVYGYAVRSQFKDDEDEGVNKKFHVRLLGVGKPNRSDHPYLIANEYISAAIGQFLGLPTPPFAIVQKADARTRMFTSLRFDGKMAAQNSEPSILWSKNRWITTGIVLFDVLIANPDRHFRNIKVDNRANPKVIHVFDHDRALFYCHSGRGRQWLLSRFDDAMIGPYHCLPPVMTSSLLFEDWAHRIRSIPDWFFEEVSKDVRGFGISKSDALTVIDFLKHRRDNISPLLLKCKKLFPNVSDWKLFV